MADMYLLHFERPYWGKARHYVGYTKFTAEERIATHRSGKGSLLVNYALNKKGIEFQLAFKETFDTCEEARKRERQLKQWHGLNRVCPICAKAGVNGR